MTNAYTLWCEEEELDRQITPTTCLIRPTTIKARCPEASSSWARALARGLRTRRQHRRNHLRRRCVSLVGVSSWTRRIRKHRFPPTTRVGKNHVALLAEYMRTSGVNDLQCRT